MYGLGFTMRSARYTSNGSANVRLSNLWLSTSWKMSPANMCSFTCRIESMNSLWVKFDLTAVGPYCDMDISTDPLESLILEVQVTKDQVLSYKHLNFWELNKCHVWHDSSLQSMRWNCYPPTGWRRATRTSSRLRPSLKADSALSNWSTWTQCMT